MYAELQTKEAGKQVHVLDVAVVYSDIKGTIDKVYDVGEYLWNLICLLFRFFFNFVLTNG